MKTESRDDHRNRKEAGDEQAMVGDDDGRNAMAIVAIAMVVRAGGGLLNVDHGARSDQ